MNNMHRLNPCATCPTRMAVPGTNSCAVCTLDFFMWDREAKAKGWVKPE